MKEKITRFWFALNAYLEGNKCEAPFFNKFAIDYCEANGIDRQTMNRVISAWACTLGTFPPPYLLKERETAELLFHQYLFKVS